MSKKMKLWELDTWAEEVVRELYERAALFTIDVLTATIRFSPEVGVAPYAKGHFIANWNIAPTKNKAITTQTMTAQQKITEIKSIIKPEYFHKYQVVHMTNALDYADKVEYKGWSRGEEQAYAPVAKTDKYIKGKYI